ncbi:hypothetical protein HDU93_003636 [Gonapodya sp. JEL0774]|nr:hypothetical protein HDU93_003636 [Gonapodya sp. JEL0774]
MNVILILALFLPLARANTQGIASECAVVEAMFSAAGKTWSTPGTGYCCTEIGQSPSFYPGVSCDSDGHVTGINFNKVLFNSAFPNSLSSLVRLTFFAALSNGFSGTVNPNVFAGLNVLYAIDLSDNSLAGSLPDLSGLPALKQFKASNNAFYGNVDGLIPAGVGSGAAAVCSISGNAGLTTCKNNYPALCGTLPVSCPPPPPPPPPTPPPALPPPTPTNTAIATSALIPPPPSSDTMAATRSDSNSPAESTTSSSPVPTGSSGGALGPAAPSASLLSSTSAGVNTGSAAPTLSVPLGSSAGPSASTSPGSDSKLLNPNAPTGDSPAASNLGVILGGVGAGLATVVAIGIVIVVFRKSRSNGHVHLNDEASTNLSQFKGPDSVSKSARPPNSDMYHPMGEDISPHSSKYLTSSNLPTVVSPVPPSYSGSGSLRYHPQSSEDIMIGQSAVFTPAQSINFGMEEEWQRSSGSRSMSSQNSSNLTPSAPVYPPHWGFTYLAGAAYANAPSMNLPEPNPVYVTTRDYVARMDDELNIPGDTHVQLHTIFRDGWALATNLDMGRSGQMPLDYLDLGVDPPRNLASPSDEFMLTSRRIESRQPKSRRVTKSSVYAQAATAYSDRAVHGGSPYPPENNNNVTTIRPETAMSTPRDIQQIEAAANGQAQRVRLLFGEGANPNTQKGVTSLTCTIGRETKTDSEDCESVLALAILHANEDVVKALLEEGADANGEETHIQLNDPKEIKDAFISPFTLHPSLPIVRLLLSHGAVVTGQAAGKWPDGCLLQILQDHQSNPVDLQQMLSVVIKG